jgi:hypothetical protein
MCHPDYPAGTRVEYDDLPGTVVDPDDPLLDPQPKNRVSTADRKDAVLILFDDDRNRNMAYYPYYLIPMPTTLLHKIPGTPAQVTPREQGDLCPACGTPGEWHAMATKCPKCWKVW